MNQNPETLSQDQDPVSQLNERIKRMKRAYDDLGGGEVLNARSLDAEFENSLIAIIDHAEFIAKQDPRLLHGEYEKALCSFVQFISKKMDGRGFRRERQVFQDRLYSLALENNLTELSKISHAVLDTKYFTLQGRVSRLFGGGKKKKME